MQKPSFVYTTYIKTTPERLWQALTDPAFTRALLGTTFETDWQVGSTMTWHNHGVTSPTPSRSSSNPSRTAGSPTPGTRSRPSWPRSDEVSDEVLARRPAKAGRRSRSRSSRSTSCAS